MDGRVELGYMTDQGRDSDTDVGEGGVAEHSPWLSTAQVCTERDEMIRCFVQMS